MDSVAELHPPKHVDSRDDDRHGRFSLGALLGIVLLALLVLGVWGFIALWSLLQRM